MSQFAVKWIFVLAEDYSISIKAHLPAQFAHGCAFEDRKGQRRLEIHPNGTAKVLAPYAGDGCTPKYAVWDIVFGTPDGVPHSKARKPKAYRASRVHDVLYQFLDAGLPLNRASADRIFLAL